MVFSLRSGWSLRCGRYDKAFCESFLRGEYPDCSTFTLLELQQLKSSMDDNYNTLEPALLEMRVDLIFFLLAQWRNYHEDLVQCSTPLNTNQYLSTYERVFEYCKVNILDTDSDDEFLFNSDPEFFCNTCNQINCVSMFKNVHIGVHIPSYGEDHLPYRSNIGAHNESILSFNLYRKKKQELIEQKYPFMLINLD